MREVGIASWYGYPHHGRETASGEIYDMYKLTAAHRTLPFGTRVHVINLENGKTVDVEINDRGPTVKGRVIDVSRAAAEILGIYGTGIARVQIEALPSLTHTRPPLAPDQRATPETNPAILIEESSPEPKQQRR